MAVFPGPQDLGPVNPGSGERPIGQASADGLIRGVQQLGQGVQQLGQGIESVNDAQARYEQRNSSLGRDAEYTALQERMKHDTNYGPDANGQTFTERYAAQAQQISDAWAAKIGSPGMRDLFVQGSKDQIARLSAAADDHVFALKGQNDVAQLDQNFQQAASAAAEANDHGRLDAAFRDYGAGLDALGDRGVLSPEEKLRKKQLGAIGGAKAFNDHMAITNPNGAQNSIQSPPGSDQELAEWFIHSESGGNPLARNPSSSAGGLGQFIDSTWLSTLKAHRPDIANGRSDADLLALKYDPNLSRQMVVASIQDNRQALNAQGVDASAGNLYLAHFLGPGGAAAVLKASPDTPVAELLDPKAIAANRGVLAGKTAGSVQQWAATKMGGIVPGEGSINSFLPAEVRASMEAENDRAIQRQTVQDSASFQVQRDNMVSEALNTGAVTNPIELPVYIAHFGHDRGPIEYQNDQIQVQTGRTISSMAMMGADERVATVSSLMPQLGDPNYAVKMKAYQVAVQAADRLDKEFGTGSYVGSKESDPAGAAIARLPASQERYANLSNTLRNPSASPDERAQAAQSFAETTLLDQRHFGVPDGQQHVAPKSYVDALNKSLTAAGTAEDPQARLKLIAQVQSEAAMWGQKYWPDVMRQLAPAAQPIVRAIAAGGDPIAMTRLLSLPPDEQKHPAVIMKQQNGTKATEVTTALDDAFRSLRQTMVGAQLDQDYPGYYHLAQDLAALYVRDGQGAPAAATKAFNDLIGNRYDFKDTYRIPKSAGVNPDDVQAGAQAARSQLEQLGIKPAADDMGLGADNAADSFFHIGRDGKWVTAADNSGLNLIYYPREGTLRAGAPVAARSSDGKVFKLPWDRLASLGAGARQPPPQDAEAHQAYRARLGIEAGSGGAAVLP